MLPLFMAGVVAWARRALRALAAHRSRWAPSPRSLCVALFVCTGMIYARLRLLQEWATPLTPINYLLLGCASGTTLAAAYAALAGSPLAAAFAAAAFAADRWRRALTRVASLRAQPRAAPALDARRRRSASPHPRIAQTLAGVHGRLVQHARVLPRRDAAEDARRSSGASCCSRSRCRCSCSRSRRARRRRSSRRSSLQYLGPARRALVLLRRREPSAEPLLPGDLVIAACRRIGLSRHLQSLAAALAVGRAPRLRRADAARRDARRRSPGGCGRSRSSSSASCSASSRCPPASAAACCSCRSSAASFPFHLDFVRGAGLLVALAERARRRAQPAAQRARRPAARAAAGAARLGELDRRRAARPRAAGERRADRARRHHPRHRRADGARAKKSELPDVAAPDRLSPALADPRRLPRRRDRARHRAGRCTARRWARAVHRHRRAGRHVRARRRLGQRAGAQPA